MVIVRRQLMLGDKLIQEGLITEDQLTLALMEQKKTRSKLGETLIKLGYITSAELLPVLAGHIGVSSVIVTFDDLSSKLIEKLPEDFILKNSVIPLKKEGNKLVVAMADPTNVFLIDEIQLRTKEVIKPILAFSSNIEEVIKEFEEAKSQESTKSVDSILSEFTGLDGSDVIVDEVEELESGLSSDSAPIIRIVNAIISKAVRMGASDIHIEPFSKNVRVRCRVDGVLVEINSFAKTAFNAIVSRVKIMSDLDIAEKRLPQDGRFRIKTVGRNIDFRISTLPTINGEKIVMRILDKGTQKLDLDILGYSDEDLNKIIKALEMPYGMILVTGPTGSGKSTTLYSALNKLNDDQTNISTAEDPVEYEIEGINQVHCKADIGLDFASALRSFLRQDPDIIMVGEIRDKETAEISIKAALTGHLLLSTLHTNDAPGSIHRLINMGIEPFMISASLLAVTAQRLARRICPDCKEVKEYQPGMFASLSVDYEKYKDKTFYHGKGCPHCNGTGYKGRVGIHEIMVLDDDLRELISKRATTLEIRNKAQENGMKTLRDHALVKAAEGATTLEEVLRVTMV